MRGSGTIGVGMGVLLLTCLMISGCELGNSVPGEPGEAVELRTYQVPPDNQVDVRRMLSSVLGRGDTATGRVSSGPGGALVVVAPPGVLEGIEELIDAGFEASPVSQPVRLTYWFVIGRSLDAARATQPYSVRGGRSIPQLESVLNQIAGVQGPTEFHLLEQVQLASMYQARADTIGRIGTIV